MQFKKYLLREQTEFLAQKVADVLSQVQSQDDDANNLNNRKLLELGEDLVRRLRAILRQHWAREEYGYLKVLQQVAVFVATAIDSKQQMREVLSNVREHLEALLRKMEQPVNRLAAQTVPKAPPPAAPPI